MTGFFPGNQISPSKGSFNWQIDYQAMTGYLQDESTPNDPRYFQEGMTVGVQTQTENAVGITYKGTFPNGAPVFPATPTSGSPGVIAIKADGTIPSNDKQASESMTINVGLAMNSKPVLCVQLLPNLTYLITAKPAYFICSANFTPGQIVDLAVSSTPYKIELKGVTTVSLDFTAENVFQPSTP